MDEFNEVNGIIILFIGRSKIKKHIKNKPHKWSINMFAIASASGIVLDFERYTGKGTVEDLGKA